MKTVTIYPPVEIFDDPKFCSDQTSFCTRLFNHTCSQFSVILAQQFDRVGPRKFIKCQQCKDLYSKSKTERDDEREG